MFLGMVDVPPHIDEELFESGKTHFNQSQYDSLREFVRAVQRSKLDLSDTMMNIQGHELGVVNGVEAPKQLGRLTVSEYIRDQADVEELESVPMALEDAFTSWEAGALDSLKE